MEQSEAPRDAWPHLMVLVQSGDQKAYTYLLRSLVPVIRSLVRRWIADEVLVEDVIQDVLLTLHRVRHTYDPAAPFLPWLMAISHARAVDALRRRGRYSQREVPEENMDTQAITSDGEADYAYADLSSLLDQLPERQRQVIENVHLREMSLAETALNSNLTVSAVKSLLHRAITNLRRSGQKYDRS